MTWRWTQWKDSSYLTCDLLKGWAHGFFTRGFWPHPPERLTSILSSGATVHRVKQVHGNQILSPLQSQGVTAPSGAGRPLDQPPARPEADALVSDGSGQALWVCSADCNPVLVGDRATGRVAAIHAGWRGTALRIVCLTVEQLLSQGSCRRDLVVAIGPAIAGEVYQVSTQVAAQVVRTIYHQPPGLDEIDNNALLETVATMSHSPLLFDPDPGRTRLDVRRINALQLEQLGLAKSQIAIAPHCTFQQPQQFFSYRRTREKNVQWAGIVSP